MNFSEQISPNGEAVNYSAAIKACRDGVVSNPYQGTDKKVLFVCSMGILRSATAARLYSYKYNTRCAGTWDEALIPLTPILIAWADEIVFVNQSNYNGACNKFPGAFKDAKVKILNIPDTYPHMHPSLINAFEQQYEPIREQEPSRLILT